MFGLGLPFDLLMFIIMFITVLLFAFYLREFSDEM
jgi:hypothetical protein